MSAHFSVNGCEGEATIPRIDDKISALLKVTSTYNLVSFTLSKQVSVGKLDLGGAKNSTSPEEFPRIVKKLSRPGQHLLNA